MDTYNDPTPWVHPFTGERFGTLPSVDGQAVQGFLYRPREIPPAE